MSNELATTDIQAETLEKVLISGDLAKLTPAQRVNYYNAVCQSIGLNPLTKPFEYITLNNKLTLYAKKDATEQLRTKHQISITGLEKSIGNDMITVTAYAQNGAGRTDADIGVVAIRNQQGDALANSMMKAVTKAKRRVTLSICGLGWLDESELETIPSAKQVVITEDGEIIDEEPDYEPPQAPLGDTPEEQLLNAPDPEPEPAKNGNGNGKLMSAEKYREWCAKEYGYEDPEHVFNTMKLMGFDRTPMDKETRKRLAEALAVYRVHRKKGLSQDDALAEVDAFFKEPAEEGE